MFTHAWTDSDINEVMLNAGLKPLEKQYDPTQAFVKYLAFLHVAQTKPKNQK